MSEVQDASKAVGETSKDDGTDMAGRQFIVRNVDKRADEYSLLAYCLQHGPPPLALRKGRNSMTVLYATAAAADEAAVGLNKKRHKGKATKVTRSPETCIGDWRPREFELAQRAAKEAEARANMTPAEKRAREDAAAASSGNKRRKGGMTDETLLARTASDVVASLHNMPYEAQLERKRGDMLAVLRAMSQTVVRTYGSPREALPHMYSGPGKTICPLVDFASSPELSGYRNKVELTIGSDENGKVLIGFSGGRTESNHWLIKPIDNVPIVNSSTKAAAAAMQRLLDETKLPAYNKWTNEGFWRLLSVRTTSDGEVMVFPTVADKGADAAVVAAERDAFKRAFEDLDLGNGAKVSSVHWIVNNAMSEASMPDDPPVHLAGTPVIRERLDNLRFDISPQSFFQVNARGAEVLYAKIREMASIDRDTVVLDLCSGTGTIGISMAAHAKHVVGIELCEPAVVDARRNAASNDVKNIEFIVGKVEDHIQTVLNKYNGTKLVAIVDPPRAGLHPDALRRLRACRSLEVRLPRVIVLLSPLTCCCVVFPVARLRGMQPQVAWRTRAAARLAPVQALCRGPLHRRRRRGRRHVPADAAHRAGRALSPWPGPGVLLEGCKGRGEG